MWNVLGSGAPPLSRAARGRRGTDARPCRGACSRQVVQARVSLYTEHWEEMPQPKGKGSLPMGPKKDLPGSSLHPCHTSSSHWSPLLSICLYKNRKYICLSPHHSSKGMNGADTATDMSPASNSQRRCGAGRDGQGCTCSGTASGSWSRSRAHRCDGEPDD